MLVSLKMCVIGNLYPEGIWSELFRTQQFIYVNFLLFSHCDLDHYDAPIFYLSYMYLLLLLCLYPGVNKELIKIRIGFHVIDFITKDVQSFEINVYLLFLELH